MEYGEYELEERIESFIMKRCETEQCDFKQEWHQKAEDLIKDIVCFANTVHDKDCYLVFGISDDYQIVGMTKPRRKQADIIDTLNKLYFAGDIVPKVELNTIFLDGKEIDVLIIKNTDFTPIYLKKPYGRMKVGCIYTRIGDKNTPNDDNAEYHEIEMLWKKRLGLTKSPLEFIYDSMNNKLNWNEYEESWYHIYKPEYVIRTYWDDDECSDNRRRDEFYSYSQLNELTSFMRLDIMANQTVLEGFQIVCLDSGRLTIPVPEWGYIKQEFNPYDIISYKYYSNGTKRYTLLKFMYDHENREERYAYRNLMKVVLIFDSENERFAFEDFITYYFEEFKDRLAKADKYNYIETESKKKTEVYREYLNTGFILNEMLREYRSKYEDE